MMEVGSGSGGNPFVVPIGDTIGVVTNGYCNVGQGKVPPEMIDYPITEILAFLRLEKRTERIEKAREEHQKKWCKHSCFDQGDIDRMWQPVFNALLEEFKQEDITLRLRLT